MVPSRRFALLCSILTSALALSSNIAAALPCQYGYQMSTVPPFVRVGGMTTPNGVPDPSIAYTVTIRDFANNPVAGSVVTLDFCGCTDTRLCTAPVSGQQTTCGTCFGGAPGLGSVTGVTNAAGQVTFWIMGAGTNSGGGDPSCTGSPPYCPGAGRGCVRVYADVCPHPWEEIGTATAVDYDQDGAAPNGKGGVNAADMATMKSDIAAVASGAPYLGRSDFSSALSSSFGPSVPDYAINASDLAWMKMVVANAAGPTGSGAGCVAGGQPYPYCP